MATKRGLLVIAAFIFSLVLAAYLFTYGLWKSVFHSGKLSLTNECTDPTAESGARVNPNKMLFISCGGFID